MIHVVHLASVMNRAGQETLIMNILRNINKNEIDISILCTLHEIGDYDEEITKLNSNIYYLPTNVLSRLKYINHIGTILSYYSFFKKHPEFQIFHMHTYHAFDAFLGVLGAKIARVPKVIVHSHNSKAPHRFLHYLFRMLLNCMDIERFACSKLAAEWLFGTMKNATVINNGIMLDSYSFDISKREKIRFDLGIDRDKFVIGHIGRFNFQKNHSFLIDIFEQIYNLNKNSLLLLVGCGEMQAEIRQKVRDKGLNECVRFLNVRNDISDLLCGFDVFLFPSLFEGLSVVLIEAQASGLPCIISDTNSKEILLTDDVHMLSLCDDVSVWANMILRFNGYSRTSLSNISKLRLAGYDIITTVNSLEICYKKWSK